MRFCLSDDDVKCAAADVCYYSAGFVYVHFLLSPRAPAAGGGDPWGDLPYILAISVSGYYLSFWR